MQEQDLSGALVLYNDVDRKGFEGDLVLNGFAEFIRNLLVCKDEKAADLLEVVESFRDRYIETGKTASLTLLIAALNVLNESEINYKAARNKRLHVEMALIKLCYLRQAIELSAGSGELIKKKIVEPARSVPFRKISSTGTNKERKREGRESRSKIDHRSSPPQIRIFDGRFDCSDQDPKRLFKMKMRWKRRSPFRL